MNRKVSHPSDQPHGEVDVGEGLGVAEVDEVVAEDVVPQVVKLLDKTVSLLANPPLELANLFDLVHLRLVTIL